jgi:hypothetical protein
MTKPIKGAPRQSNQITQHHRLAMGMDIGHHGEVPASPKPFKHGGSVTPAAHPNRDRRSMEKYGSGYRRGGKA